MWGVRITHSSVLLHHLLISKRKFGKILHCFASSDRQLELACPAYASTHPKELHKLHMQVRIPKDYRGNP